MLPGVERTQHEFGPQVALLVALVAAVLPGCCDHRRPWSVRQASPRAHLVFNPPPLETTETDLPRSEWPVTVVYDAPDEIITYREWIMDRQGWSGTDHDRPYRRFDSVRVGHTRR